MAAGFWPQLWCSFCSQRPHVHQRQDELQPSQRPPGADRGARRRTPIHFRLVSVSESPPSYRSHLCFSAGRLLDVHPADAHRGSDFSVDSEPDDGFPSAVQPLLQTVRLHTAGFLVQLLKCHRKEHENVSVCWEEPIRLKSVISSDATNGRNKQELNWYRS